MAVVGDGALHIASLRVVVREREVARRGDRALLQLRRQEISGRPLFGGVQVLAVTNRIVEPNISRELVVSVGGLSQAVGNRVISESTYKLLRTSELPSEKYKPTKRIIGFGPHCRPHLSARGDHILR